MRATILTRPPVSGTIPEVHFDAKGECTWVRFEDDDGEEWAAVFGSGQTAAAKAVTLDPGPYAFVVAGGRGYFIDTARRSLIYRAECDYLGDVLAVPGRNLVAAATFWTLYVFSPDSRQPLWEDVVACDGIRLTSATGQVIKAEVEDYDGWYEYELRLDQWEQHRGPLLRPAE